MTNNKKNFGLIGKLIFESNINVLTGIRVGGSTGGLKIGGVDQNVIIDPLGKPYIPGSSLKGKLRSLLEHKLSTGIENYYHPKSGQRQVSDMESYLNCPSSQIFGSMLTTTKISDEHKSIPTLTRLYVRDTYLDETSFTDKMLSNIDLAFTEVKYETAIDRIRGNAAHGSLRQIERVPAGAKFKDLEMIFNVFYESDKQLLRHLFTAMQLLEDDYLGGMGSRGYGKIKFENVRLYWNKAEDYETGELRKHHINASMTTITEIIQNSSSIIEKIG